jgi:hypothetical protein
MTARRFYRKKRYIILAAFTTVIVLSSVLSDPVPENKPMKVDVAQFVGQTPDDAHNQLEDELDAQMTTNYDDFSPIGRDPNRYEDIIVAADRKTVIADDPVIRFWTLRPSESKWFNQHQKMPNVRVGSKCDAEYGSSVFEPVADLLLIASKPGAKRARYAERIGKSYDWRTDQTLWPTDWAEPQRTSLGSLWEAVDSSYPFTSVVQGQRPAAGSALKSGQLMVIYCSSSELADSPSSDKDAPIPPMPNGDGDDDFDLPDRFCPTRFC